MDAVVEAAGGVVWRESNGGQRVDVFLVHRPKYDDWTLPKGKLNRGEDFETAALREVEEETGLQCALGPELPSSSYVDGRGRPKLVRYWSMVPVSGSFTPSDEVDDARWFPLSEAARTLSYDRDRVVLAALPVSSSSRH